MAKIAVMPLYGKNVSWSLHTFYFYVGDMLESHGIIMQTCPCDVDPLTPHFYIVKLGFTGVYIIFVFLL